MIKWGGMGGVAFVFCETCRCPTKGPRYPLSLVDDPDNTTAPEAVYAAEVHASAYPGHKVRATIDGRWDLTDE